MICRDSFVLKQRAFLYLLTVYVLQTFVPHVRYVEVYTLRVTIVRVVTMETPTSYY